MPRWDPAPLAATADEVRTLFQNRSMTSDRRATPRRVLSWIYLGRIALAATAFVQYSNAAFAGAPWSGYLPIVLLLVVPFTLASYFYSHQKEGPNRAFLYAQILFDVFLLTIVVLLTGGGRSMFAPLYILVISAAALILPIVGGILIGLLASILYFAAALTSSGAVDAAVLLQAGLFAVVAIVTGYIGDRLRQTGAALGEVQTQLQRLRVDTDEILDTIGTGILTVDGDASLAYINPAATDALGLERDEWIDRPVLEHLDAIAPGLGTIIGRTATERTPFRRHQTEPLEGRATVFGVSTTLVERGEGAPPAVTAIFQDITERMRAEGLRRRTERLEAVAELSASLAHEIKNPLASIRSAVEQLAGGKVDAEEGRLLGALIVRESDRLSRLLGEFIDFARVRVTSPEPIDLREVVRNVADVIRSHPAAAGNDVSLSAELTDAPVPVRGAEDVLHRAVFNLVLNAVQWAGRDGRVELELDVVRSDLLSPDIDSAEVARLIVRDTGPGVPEQEREAIFDPFFTGRHGGTGLGLAIVQRSIDAHGGAIFVDSVTGEKGGAEFSVYLPIVAPADPAGRAAPTSPEPQES